MTEEDDFSPIAVPLNGVRTPWYVDERYLRVFTGAEYGHRCVAAIGHRDGLLPLTFVTTQNPRRRVWTMARDRNKDLVVFETLWSPGRTSDAVLKGVYEILAEANVQKVDDGYPVTPGLAFTLLKFGAQRAGVAAMRQPDFSAYVLATETSRMRQRLVRNGVEQAVADIYSVV